MVVARVGLLEVTVELCKHIFLSLEWSQIMVSFFSFCSWLATEVAMTRNRGHTGGRQHPSQLCPALLHREPTLNSQDGSSLI